MSPHSENDSLVIERDRWLGQEIFRLSLAEEFIKSVPGRIPPSEYDDLFANVLDCYQYRSACEDPYICGETFPSGYVADKSKYQEVLFAYVGSLNRTESEDKLKDVLARLRKYIPFSHDWRDPQSHQDPVDEVSPGPAGGTLVRLSPPALEQLEQDAMSFQDKQFDGLARYTALLHEHGQKIGEMPSYGEAKQSIRSGLPWFSTTVSYRGVEGHGSASTKKVAKQAASKDACDKLGLSHRISHLYS
ncbi:hypothetical protein ANI_1_2256094 [Paecilomyces variotii No. 5]|uniref:DRBM domain-containing protein n=1 Tax=Byssochlamys spectabilis (strain No. 5 / NBRC 109023) TaxID=1356009 RepID=V5GAB8_BYSSN|nr:hypothetical protein ANI_1_2256094 [Paecilomyces variotii No. 5]